MKLKLIALCAIMLLFSGCYRQISITSNTFADMGKIPFGFTPGNTFYIYSNGPITSIPNGTALEKETAYKIGKILSEKNYIVHNKNTHNTDYVMAFTLHVSKSVQTTNEPRYIPGPTLTKRGNIRTPENGQITQYEEQQQTPGSVILVPEQHTYYTTLLEINVYDGERYRLDGKLEQLWSGSATNTRENSDIRDTIDYLIIEALKYFGKNTQREVTSSVYCDNKEIENLRTGYFRN